MDLKFALMDGEVFWTFNRIAIDQRLGRPEPLNGYTHRERDDFFFGVIGEWDRDLGMSHKKYEADKRRWIPQAFHAGRHEELLSFPIGAGEAGLNKLFISQRQRRRLSPPP